MTTCWVVSPVWLLLLLQLTCVSALQLFRLPQPDKLGHARTAVVLPPPTCAHARCMPACACAEEETQPEGASSVSAKQEQIDEETQQPSEDPKVAEKAAKAALKDRIAKLEGELKEARGKLLATQDELTDSGEKGYMLLAANFERYRLKSRDELDGQAGAGKLAALRGMLPFIETFDALQAQLEGADDDEATIHKYYGGIYKQLTTLLDSMQLEAFEVAEGEKFDFLRHTQKSQRSSSTVADGFVIECLKKGFVSSGGLVRTAEVVVSTGAEKAAEEEVEDEGEGNGGGESEETTEAAV